MNRVSRQDMIATWDRLCDLDQAGTDVLVKQFMAEQPALGVYLVASMEGMEGAEHTRILELAVAAWLAMGTAAGRRLPAATPEVIERVEAANLRTLEQLDEGSEFEWQASVPKFLEHYHQRDLLGFGLEVLMSGNEETPELAPESIGMELLWLKTTIDALEGAG